MKKESDGPRPKDEVRCPKRFLEFESPRREIQIVFGGVMTRGREGERSRHCVSCAEIGRNL